MRNKNVIYTAIFGGKDFLHEPEYIPEGFDFVCFTDSETLSSRIWNIRRVKASFPDPVRSARFYKILAHQFLSEYEYSVWVDGNMLVIGDVNKLIGKYMPTSSLALYNHSYLKRRIFGLFWMKDRSFARNCIYTEAEQLIRRTESGIYMDDPVRITEQMERYRKDAYPENHGLATTMVLLRRHNDPDTIRVMQMWWEELSRGSRRDQLSFNYVTWKLHYKFSYINEDARRNRYFKKVKHAEKKNPIF